MSILFHIKQIQKSRFLFLYYIQGLMIIFKFNQCKIYFLHSAICWRKLELVKVWESYLQGFYFKSNKWIEASCFVRCLLGYIYLHCGHLNCKTVKIVELLTATRFNYNYLTCKEVWTEDIWMETQSSTFPPHFAKQT